MYNYYRALESVDHYQVTKAQAQHSNELSHSPGTFYNVIAKMLYVYTTNYLTVVDEKWKLLLREKSCLGYIHAIFTVEKLNH